MIKCHLSINFKEKVLTAYIGYYTQARKIIQPPFSCYFPVDSFVLRVFEECRTGANIFKLGPFLSNKFFNCIKGMSYLCLDVILVEAQPCGTNSSSTRDLDQ